MFQKRTVFILGAGASYPYGYPLGEGLIKDIIRCIESDEIWINNEIYYELIKTAQQREITGSRQGNSWNHEPVFTLTTLLSLPDKVDEKEFNVKIEEGIENNGQSYSKIKLNQIERTL